MKRFSYKSKDIEMEFEDCSESFVIKALTKVFKESPRSNDTVDDGIKKQLFLEAKAHENESKEDFNKYALDVSSEKLPTTTDVFRCSCGQATIVINEEEGFLVFRNPIEGKTYSLAYSNMPDLKEGDGDGDLCLSKVYNLIYDLLQNVDVFDRFVLVTSDESKYLCPYCGANHSVSELLDNYNNPQMIYSEDVEYICDICGEPGELIITGKDEAYIKCEHDCVNTIIADMKTLGAE